MPVTDNAVNSDLERLPRTSLAEAKYPFSEILKGTSKNIDVGAFGVIQPEEVGLKSMLDSGEIAKISAMFNIGSDENPKEAALVTMYDPVTDSYRVSLGGLKSDDTGKISLNNAWVEVPENTGVLIGRNGDREDTTIVGAESLWPGSGYFDADVSERHVAIYFDGKNINILDTSEYGTKLFNGTANQEQKTSDDFGHISAHTLTAKDRARIARLLEEKDGVDVFSDSKREVIDRNTTDPEGKVDIRSWAGGGEAIVVDSEKVPEPYKKLMEACDKKLTDAGVVTERSLLQAVFDTVSENMTYDLEFANEIAAGLKAKSKKINLADYIVSGRGVCRHMALASQWLGARLKEKYPQLLEGGCFTVPVNQREKDNAAHEWVRYTNKNGKVYILDVAQGFMGTLEDVVVDTNRGEERWEYFTDSQEKKRYEKFLLGHTGVKASSSFFRRKK